MKNTLIIASVIGILIGISAFANGGAKLSSDVITLTSKNTLSLNDEVNGESVNSVLKDLRAANAGYFSSCKEPVYLFLNTPGGEIQAGLELIEALKGECRQVHTITMFAASMGFQIAQSLGERLIVQNGTLMSHRARGGIKGEFGGQSPGQMENRLGFWLERINEMDQQTASRTNGKKTLKQYQAEYENELWLTGKRAVKEGYADKVVTVKCDSSLDGTITKETSFMGIPVKYDVAKCPLNTSITNVRMTIDTTQGAMTTENFLKNGGTFGPVCLITATEGTLCALDTTLTLAKINELKQTFIRTYNDNKNRVIHMTFNNDLF